MKELLPRREVNYKIFLLGNWRYLWLRTYEGFHSWIVISNTSLKKFRALANDGVRRTYSNMVFATDTDEGFHSWIVISNMYSKNYIFKYGVGE